MSLHCYLPGTVSGCSLVTLKTGDSHNGDCSLFCLKCRSCYGNLDHLIVDKYLLQGDSIFFCALYMLKRDSNIHCWQGAVGCCQFGLHLVPGSISILRFIFSFNSMGEEDYHKIISLTS